MTREQLDAIRARYGDEPLLGEMRTDRFGNLITVTREHPVVALLAEVEQLTAERDGARAEVAFLKRNYSLEAASKLRAELATTNAKVELLTAERDAAYKRGAEAMREAAAQIADAHWVPGTSKQIRALPDPEDR